MRFDDLTQIIDDGQGQVKNKWAKNNAGLPGGGDAALPTAPPAAHRPHVAAVLPLPQPPPHIRQPPLAPPPPGEGELGAAPPPGRGARHAGGAAVRVRRLRSNGHAWRHEYTFEKGIESRTKVKMAFVRLLCYLIRPYPRKIHQKIHVYKCSYDTISDMWNWHHDRAAELWLESRSVYQRRNEIVVNANRQLFSWYAQCLSF